MPILFLKEDLEMKWRRKKIFLPIPEVSGLEVLQENGFPFLQLFSKTRRAFLPTLIRLLCDTASFPERDVSNGSMEVMIMPTYQAPFLTPSTATSMCSLVTTKILLAMATAHSYFQTMLTDIRFLKSIPLSGK